MTNLTSDQDPTEVERLDAIEALKFSHCRNIVVLTGAGVSVASGISPCRGPGGLWNASKIERFAHREGIDEDSEGAARFFPLRSASLKTESCVGATQARNENIAYQ